MNSWKPVVVAALLLAAPALSGCGGIDATEDEAYLRVQRDLTAARSDPEIRKYAPAALTIAGDMLSKAKEAEDTETLRRLAFTAQQQVDLARQLTEARQREKRLMALMERNRTSERNTANEGNAARQNAPDISVRRLPEGERRYDRNRTPPPPGAAPAEPGTDRPSPDDNAAPQTGAAGGDETVSDLVKKVFGNAPGPRPSLAVGGLPRGEAALPASLKGKLQALAKLLELAPRRWVSVGGFANDFGDIAKNLKLSDDRAEAVRSYLVERGVNPERVWAVGLGDPREADPGGGAVARGVRIALRDEPFRKQRSSR